MTRNRCSPDIVRITCTDSFHEDSDAWATYRHHHLLNLRQVEGGDRARLIVPGARQRTRVVQTTAPDGTVIFERPEDPQSPVKPWRLAGPERYLFFRFSCPCGRNPQAREDELLQIAACHRRELPGQRIEINLVELERRKHVCSR